MVRAVFQFPRSWQHFHWRSKHRDTHESGSAWRVLDAKDKETVRCMWGAAHPGHDQPRYECAMCGEPVMLLRRYTLPELQHHLQFR